LHFPSHKEKFCMHFKMSLFWVFLTPPHGKFETVITWNCVSGSVYFTYFTPMDVSNLFSLYTVTCTNCFHSRSITVGTLHRFGTWLWTWPITLWTCIDHIYMDIFVDTSCCLSECQVHYNL
jgi:hypothetical protein